jgi:hypothetical protein
MIAWTLEAAECWRHPINGFEISSDNKSFQKDEITEGRSFVEREITFVFTVIFRRLTHERTYFWTNDGSLEVYTNYQPQGDDLEKPKRRLSERRGKTTVNPMGHKTKKNSVVFSPQANYTDRVTAACRRSQCQLNDTNKVCIKLFPATKIMYSYVASTEHFANTRKWKCIQILVTDKYKLLLQLSLARPFGLIRSQFILKPRTL